MLAAVSWERRVTVGRGITSPVRTCTVLAISLPSPIPLILLATVGHDCRLAAKISSASTLGRRGRRLCLVCLSLIDCEGQRNNGQRSMAGRRKQHVSAFKVNRLIVHEEGNWGSLGGFCPNHTADGGL